MSADPGQARGSAPGKESLAFAAFWVFLVFVRRPRLMQGGASRITGFGFGFNSSSNNSNNSNNNNNNNNYYYYYFFAAAAAAAAGGKVAKISLFYGFQEFLDEIFVDFDGPKPCKENRIKTRLLLVCRRITTTRKIKTIATTTEHISVVWQFSCPLQILSKKKYAGNQLQSLLQQLALQTTKPKNIAQIFH